VASAEAGVVAGDEAGSDAVVGPAAPQPVASSPAAATAASRMVRFIRSPAGAWRRSAPPLRCLAWRAGLGTGSLAGRDGDDRVAGRGGVGVLPPARVWTLCHAPPSLDCMFSQTPPSPAPVDQAALAASLAPFGQSRMLPRTAYVDPA